jgi:hypothetical protein
MKIGFVSKPFVGHLNPELQRVVNAVHLCWRVAGVLLVLFSAMNHFTHITNNERLIQ